MLLGKRNNTGELVAIKRYRAPEGRLQSPCYSSPIDIWAVGCIMDLHTQAPVAWQKGGEANLKDLQVVGNTEEDGPEGNNPATSMNFPERLPASLRSLIPNATNEAIALMETIWIVSSLLPVATNLSLAAATEMEAVWA
ncbi:Serine/threonine-protein kinase MAK [Liparis tanakae]|uniref:Serine/threonine-protein kinase MAK n=1 Tax=Liparis tanakae TaxID=230148 RepID=A0A4Z2JFV6_9TELE|nr:Serine/threonine-protein kinase MAK [Liparis tanakae]